jgi:hypothetical protein
MIDHQVIDILKSLNAEDVRQFRRFILSPYFNRSSTLVSLFELLIKSHPDFNSKKLTKEYISETIFNTKDYKDSTVRNALADLQNICEIFLMQENFRNSAALSFDYLLKELREKNIGSVFQKNSSALDKKYEVIKDVDSDYYLSRYRFELNKFNYSALYEMVKEDRDTYKQIESMKYAGAYITIHYIVEIVTIYIASVNYASTYNKPQAMDFMKSLINTLNIKGLEDIFKDSGHYFLIKIYIALLKTFEDTDNEEYYNEYKSLVKANIGKLGEDEICFHYSNLVNYCYTIKVDSEKYDKYNNELFDLYDEMLRNNYYQNKKINYLRNEIYRNMLFLGLELKKVKWVENFILTYSSRLHKSDKDNMMNLAYAYLFYENGEYMQSWKYFNKIKIDFFIYKYDIKNYALKIYFEMGYYDEALTLCENYKKFLFRNDLVSDFDKTRIRNFISYFSKLILFKVGQLPLKHFSTYRKRLELINDTMSRKWLLQKYEEQAAAIKQSKIAKSA